MPPMVEPRMAIAVHHTDTTDEDWDAGMMVKRCPADEGHLHAMHVWMDPEGDPEAKGSYKFPHHMVGMDGDVMAASVKACSAGIGVLNGGRGGADIPDSDRRGVYRHLAAHMTDADVEVPDLRVIVVNRPKTRTREERILTVDLEVRADEDKPLRIIGHPVVYNRWSEDLGGFKERVLPGAATKTIAEQDIRALFNHDPNIVLGRNKANTLNLTDEASKLRMEAFPPDTPTVRDLVITPMQRGDINQMSFAFRTIRDEWREPTKLGDLWERDIHEFRMYDVSVVTFPAYTQTDAAVRSLVGELDGIGIDWPALMALLTRAERAIPLTDSDFDLLNGSIAVLRGYLPAEPDPAGAPLTEPQAGPSVAHLRALLELRERELLAA